MYVAAHEMRMARSFAWLDGRLEPFERYALPILRIGLGGTLLMAGLHKLVDPMLWSSYMAGMFRTFFNDVLPLIDAELFMVISGVAEAVIGVALVVNVFARLAAALAALQFLAILVNLILGGGVIVASGDSLGFGSAIGIFIRDFGLFILAVGYTLAHGRETS